MAKVNAKSTKASKINPTEEKLRGLPFDSASEMKAAQKEILMSAWARVEHARAMNDILARDENDFWREEFSTGFVCVYGDNAEELVRVFADSPGIKVKINRELANADPSGENIIAALIEPMNKSFASIYYKARGFLPEELASANDQLSARGRVKDQKRG